MKASLFVLMIAFYMFFNFANAKDTYETDFIQTSQGPLMITFIGHGTLMFTYNDKVIHVDPVSGEADYSLLPKADLVLITHEHRDHLDPDVLLKISKDNTALLMNSKSAEQLGKGIVMKNGDVKEVLGLKIEAVPAYNIINKRQSGEPYHPKGNGNGYVITFADKRVYVAGDTENIPEMKQLKGIDIAFLPMNLPYTMTPEMVADAAWSFKPGIIYPYHYGSTDTQELVDLLKSDESIEVRIRQMQ